MFLDCHSCAHTRAQYISSFVSHTLVFTIDWINSKWRSSTCGSTTGCNKPLDATKSSFFLTKKHVTLELACVLPPSTTCPSHKPIKNTLCHFIETFFLPIRVRADLKPPSLPVCLCCPALSLQWATFQLMDRWWPVWAALYLDSQSPQWIQDNSAGW